MIQKLVILSLLFFSTLHADHYSITPHEGLKSVYFIKFGSFHDQRNALKAQTKIPFETHILYLKRYYSLMSPPFDKKLSARHFFQTIRKRYPDAYLVTLYRQPAQHMPLQAQEKHAINEKSDDYQEGVAYFQNGAYEEALIRFDRVLIDEPDNLDASLMYAKSLYRLKLYGDAKDAFASLLKRPLNANQKHLVKRYLAKIDAKRRRSFLDGVVSIGVGYDDNIGLACKRKTTRYGGLELQNDTDKKHSTFGIVSLALSHRYRFDSFDWVSRLYSYNEVAHSVKGNNLNYLDLSTGLLKQSGNTMSQLPVGANISYLEGDEIAHNFYLAPKFGYHWSDQGYGYIGGSYLLNRTKYADDRDYSMRGIACGLSQSFQRLQAGVEIGVDTYDPKEDVRYDIDRKAVRAEGYLKYVINRRWFVQSNLAYMDERYNDLDANVGYKRKDRLKNVALKIGVLPWQNGWLSLDVARKINDSNINAYSYDKNLYAMQYHYRLKDE